MLQNASLLIDDIEDGSLMRRGFPCAHIVYGIPATLNSANYYYFVRSLLFAARTEFDDELSPHYH